METVIIKVGRLTSCEGPLGKVSNFRTTHVRELLALLADSHPTPVLRNFLISKLWPGSSPSAGRNSLSVALCALRRNFTEVTKSTIIEANRHEIWLKAEGVSVEFELVERLKVPVLETQVEHADLVGRQSEIARLVRLITDPNVRVVSIVGVGGLGKTALARVGIENIGSERTSFIEVQEAQNEEGIAQALGYLLGLGAGTGLRETLAIASKQGARIYVLDALEHYLESSSELVEKLCGNNSKVLVTSRSPIGIKGEYLLRLSALSCLQVRGSTRSNACEMLFKCIDRQGICRSILAESEAEAICKKVDGIPLAIEWCATILAIRGKNALERVLSHRDPDSLQWRRVLAWSFWNVSEESRRLWLLLANCMCPLSSEAIDHFVTTEALSDSVSELLGHGVVHIEIVKGKSYLRMLDTLSELAIEWSSVAELASCKLRLVELWSQWSREMGIRLRGNSPEDALQQTATMLPSIFQALRDAPTKVWIQMFLDLHPFFRTFGVPQEVARLAHDRRNEAQSAGKEDRAIILAIAACCIGAISPEKILSMGRTAMASAIETGSRETILIVAAIAFRPDSEGTWFQLVQEAIDSSPITAWSVAAQFELLSMAASGHPLGIEERLIRVLKLIRKSNFKIMEHPCNGEIGYALLSRSRFSDAEAHFRRAASLRDSFGYGNDGALGLIAMCRTQQCAFSEAIELHKRILSSPHNYLNPALRTHTSLRLLGTYLEALKLDQFENDWESLVQVIEDAPDDFSQVQLKLLQATHCRLKGRPLEAISHLKWARHALTEDSRERYRQFFGDKAVCETALCLSALGRINGIWDELIPVLVNALVDRKPISIIRTLEAMATVLDAKDNLQEAVKFVAGTNILLKWIGIRRSPGQEQPIQHLILPSLDIESSAETLIDLLAQTLLGYRTKEQIILDLQLGN